MTSEVTIDEMIMVCLSGDVDLRLAGLTLLTASQKTCAKIENCDMEIFQTTFQYSLKSGAADERQRLISK